MRRTHKLPMLLLIIILSTSMLLSCGTTPTVETTTAAATTAAATTAAATTEAATTAAATEATTTEAAAATPAKVELTFLVPTRVFIQDMATNDETMFMEEQTGVHVTWQSIPQQGAEEKLAIIMASQDLPDVFFSCPISNAMLAKYGVDEQIFMPLDDLIDANAVNLKAAASKSPGGLDVLRQIDGKLYSLPTFDTCQHCEQSTKVWMYDPFVQQLGVTYPTTTDEFYAYLKKVQSTDLNGNGKKDEIAFAGAASGWHNRVDEFLMNSFLYYDYGANGFFLKDGKIDSSLDKPEYREGLKFLKKLYDEKLMYEASLTQDSPALVKLVEGSELPQVAVATGGWVGMFANFGGDRAKGFHPLAPLKGPTGFVTTPNFPSLPWQGAYVLSNKCVDPVAAIKYADLQYTKRVTLWGRAGGDKDNFYRDGKAGEKDFYGKDAVWAPLKAWNDTEPQNHSWISLGVWDYTELRASQTVKEGMDYWGKEGLEYMLFKETVDKYKPVMLDYSIPPRTFTVDEAEEVATLETQFKTFFDSSNFNFITGETKLDADWDKYISDLQKSGLTRLKELYQTAYDRQYK